MFAMLRAIDDVYRAFRFAILDRKWRKKMEKCFNEAIVVTHTQEMEETVIKFVSVIQPTLYYSLAGEFYSFYKSKTLSTLSTKTMTHNKTF
jgi:hypothetical protein